MRISATGPVVRPTQADQEAFFSGFLAGLVKAGYARSSLEELQVRLLDPQTAIASGVTVRYRADGRVFARWRDIRIAEHPGGLADFSLSHT
jgi:hypothetical protein